MFLQKEELKTGMYAHVIDEITEGDDSILEQAIAAAIEEMWGYLDIRYDAEKIFDARGTARSSLVLENTKVIVIWQTIKLCNAETIYETWKDRYDRVTKYMTKIADGLLSPPLPKKIDEDGEIVLKAKFGSNRKFTHSF